MSASCAKANGCACPRVNNATPKQPISARNTQNAHNHTREHNHTYLVTLEIEAVHAIVEGEGFEKAANADPGD